MKNRPDVADMADMPQKWVAFRLGHLGDVVLTTGVLAALGENRGWSFTVVTQKPWADVFTHHPCVTHTIALEAEELKTGPFLAFCRRLAAEHRGAGLLDLHGSLRTRLLSLFWRGPVFRYPKMSLERRIFLFTGKRLYGDCLRASTVAQRYYMAAGTPAPPPDALLPRIPLTDAERSEARTRLNALFPSPAVPVVLHPYATHALKAWPEAHWRKLAALLDGKGIPWIVLGKGNALFSDNARDMSNATSLRESCALIACCRALVSGDSGPMHLAAAAAVPVVALFGPTTREWGFFPAGSHDIVLESALPCRPCSLHGKADCFRNGECLAAISPEQVLRMIEDIS